MRLQLLAAATLLATPLLPMAAQADVITLGLQEAGTNGGAITQIASSSTGSFIYAGSYGSFSLNQISAAGSPFMAEPNFDTNSINISGAGVLDVFVTETGLSTPTGVNTFASAFTSNLFNGGVTGVIEKTMLSTSDALFTGTALASHSFIGIGTRTVASSTPALRPDYSITTEYVITATGHGDVNDTIDIASVPEPASFALLGTGLFALGLLARRRKRA